MQKALTIIVLIFLAKSLISQASLEPGIPFTRYYTAKEYGGSSQVWCAVQDNRGIMYFGDNLGVLEFDGSTWKRIYTPSKTTVRALAKDSTGRIYVGSSNEFGYLKPDKSGNLEYTSLSVLLPENERKFQDIQEIIIDSHKVYFFARNYIYIYSDNKLKKIEAELFAGYAFKLHDNIYVRQKNKGICVLHDSGVESIEQLEDSVGILTSVISFPDNKMLISDIETNWKLYNLTTKQFEKFETTAQKYLDEHRLYFTTRIDENKFTVATLTGGLVILSNSGEIIQIINEDKGLPAGRIYAISTDNLGNLWLCMQRGICKIDINYPATITGKLQNMDEYVLSAYSYNGIRYIGTLDGIYYLPKNTFEKNYIPVYRKIESFPNSCWDITTMNNLLIAGGGGYLVVLKDSSKKVLLNLNGLTSRCFTNSKRNPDLLFFGAYNRLGYLRLNPKATFENVKVLEEGYFPEIDDVVFSITEDYDGNLWVSTRTNGIYFIRFGNTDVKNYKITHLSTKNGLPDVKQTRTFDIDGNIFVTTNNGIVQANFPNKNEADSLIRFTYTNFFGKEIKGSMSFIIKMDENNYLLSGESIFYITKTPQGIVTDSIRFNRLINNFELYIPFLNDDKTISFGASDAYIQYNTKSQRDFTKPFNVAIRKVSIYNDSVMFDGSFYRQSDTLRIPVLNQPSEEIPEIDFKLNSVTVQYSGLFYEDQQETQYSYKLVGYSKNWSEWSNENKAVFTNLKQGDYTFQVKARNVYLAESHPATYQFKILHPWYLAWWAYLFYLMILTGFTFLVFKISVLRLNKQNKRLELTVSERTKELEYANEKLKNLNIEKNKYVGMVAHDLRSPIGVAQSFSELLLSDFEDYSKEEKVNFLSIIHERCSFAINLIGSFLDVAKIEGGIFELNSKKHNYIKFVKEVVERNAFLAKNKSQEIFFQTELAEIELFFDKDKLEQVLSNLLSNAVKYSNSGTRIRVEVSSEAEKIITQVIDNGQGIPEVEIPHLFNPYLTTSVKSTAGEKSTGLGLAIVKKIVDAHHGEIKVKSKTGEGSVFTLILNK